MMPSAGDIVAAVKFLLSWRKRRKERRIQEIAEQLLVAMERAQQRHPLPLVFPPKSVSQLLPDLKPSDMMAALTDLEMRGIIFRERRVTGGYTVSQVPWQR